MSEAPDLCGQCEHAFGKHSLISTTGNPMEGGITLCPEPGCTCFSTWSPRHPNMAEVVPQVPDEETIAEIRHQIQAWRGERR